MMRGNVTLEVLKTVRDESCCCKACISIMYYKSDVAFLQSLLNYTDSDDLVTIHIRCAIVFVSVEIGHPIVSQRKKSVKHVLQSLQLFYVIIST
jgi:hypothetical protein